MTDTHIETRPDGSRTETIDHGDGTGERTTYDPSGEVVATEAVTDLPVPAAEPPMAPLDRLLAAGWPSEQARAIAAAVETSTVLAAEAASLAAANTIAKLRSPIASAAAAGAAALTPDLTTEDQP